MSTPSAKSRLNSSAPLEAAFPLGAQTPIPWSAFGPLTQQAARNALIGLDGFSAALNAWRSLIDASRIIIREQQDTALHAWGVQLAARAGIEQDENAAAEQAFIWPMSTAVKSYEQMSDAVLQAQHNLLEAFSRSAARH